MQRQSYEYNKIKSLETNLYSILIYEGKEEMTQISGERKINSKI